MGTKADKNILKRVQLRVTGTVQGVGFRPFVYTLARHHSLTGSVCNSGGTVEITVQGKESSVNQFVLELRSKAPPLSKIDQIEIISASIDKHAREQFVILESKQAHDSYQVVPPDTATCSACLEDLLDPANCRYHYPFTNCTNCGPRFTIIESLPYDRATTTMSTFPMCPSCQAEYEDPGNRRFHAQPNACFTCGPSITFVDKTGNPPINNNDLSLAETIKQLQAGKIIAIKGLGGFHLACDATSFDCVETLRSRKQRYGKPLAVMFANLAMLKSYCQITAQEEELLTCVRRPIVLVPNIATPVSRPLADNVSPGLNLVGAMLPYTPLHHLLLQDVGSPLVMTSGNLSEEPICIDNEEAFARLENICDGFLVHNRPIAARYDDSVVRVISGLPRMIRRARSYAPEPITLPFSAQATALAFGAHLKNTFCFVDENRAFLSQHIGDLDNPGAEDHFQETLAKYTSLFKLKAEVVACDLHSDYLSTQLANAYAQQHNLPLVSVQHHHAHIVSCMVEHGLTEPVIGIAFDGIGYGPDHTAWGGEFLLANLSHYQRLGSFSYTPMPGGELAIKQPWRMALGYLFSGQLKEQYSKLASRIAEHWGKHTSNIVQQQLERQINTPLTSSCGRLFDGVSALLGICLEASYEGEAAVLLEMCATKARQKQDNSPYPFVITDNEQSAGFHINPGSIIEAICSDITRTVSAPEIAWKFHLTIAEIIKSACGLSRLTSGTNTVCLSGGVFQNALLLELTQKILTREGFKVYIPSQVPVNDGGISLGQAVIALAQSGKINQAF